MSTKHCHALLVAYDGGAFAGFQRQPPLPTVQGALEDALVALGLPARIEGAGRTDRGVHACRQVVAFRSSAAIDPEELPSRLSSLLPEGLEVLAATRMPYAFHPRFSSITKVYRYRVSTAPSPWAERFTWILPDPRGFPTLREPPALDREAMERALSRCRGWHDFSLLTHPRAQGKARRRVDGAELRIGEAGTLYELTFTAEGFLRHQIRNLVGMTISAGLGLTSEAEVARLLSGEGERWRGARAPGRGLTLLRVGYRQGEDPFP